MMHISFGFYVVKTVQNLFLGYHAERCNGEHLCLAACKETAAVYFGKKSNLRVQGAQVIDSASVHSLALFGKPCADNIFLQLVKTLVNHRQALFVCSVKLRMNLFIYLCDVGVSLRLVI